jgi:hypothetical protein
MKSLVKLTLGLLLVAVAVPARAQGGDVEAAVAGYYQQYLKRTPSWAEVRPWVNHVRAGQSLPWVQAQILGSQEYFDLYGDNPRQWATGLYEDVLDRTPAADEVAGWLVRYGALGGNRTAVANEFLLGAARELATRAAPDRRPLLPRDWERGWRSSRYNRRYRR